MYYLIGNSYIRVIVVNLEESDALDRLAKMRPSPSYYIAHGSTSTIQDIYSKAKSRNLVKRDARWTFVFQDWNDGNFPKNSLSAQVTFMTMTGTLWSILFETILDRVFLHVPKEYGANI